MIGYQEIQDRDSEAMEAQEEADHAAHCADCAPCHELDIQREQTAGAYVKVDDARRALERGIREALNLGMDSGVRAILGKALKDANMARTMAS